jgi:hypothetical protein
LTRQSGTSSSRTGLPPESRRTRPKSKTTPEKRRARRAALDYSIPAARRMPGVTSFQSHGKIYTHTSRETARDQETSRVSGDRKIYGARVRVHPRKDWWTVGSRTSRTSPRRNKSRADSLGKAHEEVVTPVQEFHATMLCTFS